MGKEFILDTQNRNNWAGQKRAIGGALQVLMDNATTSLIVKIDEHSERSPKSLRGYWRLIGVITKHLNTTNLENWEDTEVSDMFKENIGFVNIMQMADIYYHRFKDSKEGHGMLFEVDQFFYKCCLEYFPQNNPYVLCDRDRNIIVKKEGSCVGPSLRITPKSLKKKKGCTLEDMEKLIGEVLRFGADIPDCVLTSEEERAYIKHYKINKTEAG